MNQAPPGVHVPELNPMPNPKGPAKQYGLMALPVGAGLMVKCRDKKTRFFSAKLRRTEEHRAEAEGRTLRVVCRCFFCNKDYPSEAELIADHPEMKAMADNEEPHVFAHFCEDPADPQGSDKVKQLEQEEHALKKAIEAVQKRHNTMIAKLADSKDIAGDMDTIRLERQKLTDLEKEVDATGKRRKELAENIVGLLSDYEVR